VLLHNVDDSLLREPPKNLVKLKEQRFIFVKMPGLFSVLGLGQFGKNRYVYPFIGIAFPALLKSCSSILAFIHLSCNIPFIEIPNCHRHLHLHHHCQLVRASPSSSLFIHVSKPKSISLSPLLNISL
jgi:hypothetical protein